MLNTSRAKRHLTTAMLGMETVPQSTQGHWPVRHVVNSGNTSILSIPVISVIFYYSVLKPYIIIIIIILIVIIVHGPGIDPSHPPGDFWRQ